MWQRAVDPWLPRDTLTKEDERYRQLDRTKTFREKLHHSIRLWKRSHLRTISIFQKVVWKNVFDAIFKSRECMDFPSFYSTFISNYFYFPDLSVPSFSAEFVISEKLRFDKITYITNRNASWIKMRTTFNKHFIHNLPKSRTESFSNMYINNLK